MIALARQPNASPENLLIWARVKDKDEVMSKLRLMDEALAAGRAGRKLLIQAAEAHGWIEPEKKRGRQPHENGDYGWSLQSLERLRDKLRNGEPWTVAINGAKSPVAVARGIPPATSEYIKRLCGEVQRVEDGHKEAWRELMRQIRRGESIPGLGTWAQMYIREHPHLPLPAACPPAYMPRSLSYKNFLRHAPSEHDKRLIRIGRYAAASYRPLVLTTRKGVHVGAVYMFDDMVLDNKVVLGRDHFFRPLELDVLDYASGCQFAHATLAAITDEAGVKEAIKQRHMLFFVAHVLCNIGYSPAGTKLVVENATAALPENMDGLMDAWSDGTIKIERSSVERTELIQGMFRPDPKGNPRAKAALESLHRLKHIITAALPGQTGKDRDNAPAEMYGRDQYTRQLQRAICEMWQQDQRIAAALESQIVFGHMPFHLFDELLFRLYDRMNKRTDHDLEGWDEHWITEFIAAPGVPGLAIDDLKRMPADDVAGVRALISTDPARYTARRRMSPHEVWNRGKGELARLSWIHAPQILGAQNGALRTLGVGGTKGGIAYQFAFEDMALGAGTHVYLGEVTTPTGAREMLRAGETYQTFVIPFDGAARMIVCQAPRKDGEVGQVLGWVPRRDKPAYTDADGVGHAIAAVKRVQRLLEAPALARHETAAAEQQATRDENTRLIAAAKELAAAKPEPDEQRPAVAAGSAASHWAENA